MLSDKEFKSGLDLVAKMLDNHFIDVLDNKMHFNHWCNKYNFNGASGSTRMVIIDEAERFVIKMDCLWACDSEDNDFSYTRNEFRNYLFACDEGINHMFAEIRPLIKIGEKVVYIQEYAQSDEDYLESMDWDKDGEYSYIDEEGLSHYSGDDDDCEQLTDDFLYTQYSYEDMNDFHDFCGDNAINDIHDGNVGETADGRWVVIDYAGYRNREYDYNDNPEYAAAYWDRLKGEEL